MSFRRRPESRFLFIFLDPVFQRDDPAPAASFLFDYYIRKNTVLPQGDPFIAGKMQHGQEK